MPDATAVRSWTATFLLAVCACGVAHANEPAAVPPAQAKPETHPASTPTTAPAGVSEDDDVIPAARAFVRDLDGSAVDRAYALTTPAFQQANTREAFATQVADLCERYPDLPTA